jgi:Cyclophilin-like family
MTKERAKTKRTFTGPVFGLFVLLVADAALGQAGGSNAMEKGMEIRILIEGTALAATLEDNAASRDFVAQLPLDLTLEDHNATEKIADLPSRLSTEGTPEGVDPDVGRCHLLRPLGEPGPLLLRLRLFAGSHSARPDRRRREAFGA